jgi:hypothetical protein
LHEGVDTLVGVVMTFVGEMQVEHGGFEPGMPEVELDETEVDAGFEQMGSVRMSERMDGQAQFGETGAAFGLTEGPLDAIAAHGKSGAGTLFLIASGGRKEPGFVPVCCPVGSEQRQGLFGQGDVTVFSALASVDMDDHTLRVDVGNLQVEGFVEAETQTINSGEVDLIVQGSGGVEEPPDFFHTEDGRETVCGLGADEREGMPVTLEDVLEEELDATVADAHRSRGESVNVFPVQEVVLEFRFGDAVWGFAIELREQTNFADIGCLSAFTLATELEGGDHLLTQRGHEISPFGSCGVV